MASKVADLVAGILSGREYSASIRKVPSQSSTAGWWVDLSMTAGNPLPNYYATAPLAAATLDPWRGIVHGDDKAPFRKRLVQLSMVTPSAALVCSYKLLDYLLYYPFVDLDSPDYQPFDNTITLPRFTDGDGVMAMLVSVAPTTGGGSATFDYINHNGDLLTSPVQTFSLASAPIASLISSEPATGGSGPFLLPCSGCKGIRQVVGWQNLVANGGLGALVLVKPVVDHAIYEVGTTHEADFIGQRNGPPLVADGAYVNLIANCAASIAGSILHATLKYTWD